MFLIELIKWKFQICQNVACVLQNVVSILAKLNQASSTQQWTLYILSSCFFSQQWFPWNHMSVDTKVYCVTLLINMCSSVINSGYPVLIWYENYFSCFLSLYVSRNYFESSVVFNILLQFSFSMLIVHSTVLNITLILILEYSSFTTLFHYFHNFTVRNEKSSFIIISQ
jgi:hypothetical protein